MRAVPGGYDIDRWPITVPLGAGESLPGWLMRVGLRYQLTPMQLLRELRVLHRPTGYDRVLERLRPHTGHLAAHLGVPAGDLLAAAPTGALEAALARHLVYHRHTRPGPPDPATALRVWPNPTRGGERTGPTRCCRCACATTFTCRPTARDALRCPGAAPRGSVPGPSRGSARNAAPATRPGRSAP